MVSKARLNKSEIARKYRDKYGMEMPTLKLARIMREKEPLLFNSIDHARTTLRAIENKIGKGSGIKVTHKMPERPKNPYKIAASDEESFPNFYIRGHKKGLIISDIHLPYHNIEALTACIDFAQKEKPDFIFINGDLLDFHSLSYFQKDPRKKRFNEELEMMKDFIGMLKSVFKCKIYFKFGNHEERYNNFLFQKAHELLGVEEFDLVNIILKRVPDITIINERRDVVIAGLPILHGHEYGRGVFNPVNAARGYFYKQRDPL